MNPPSRSLYPEDRLVFASLLCLNIQEDSQIFSEEEMSLLLQGLQSNCALFSLFSPLLQAILV